MQSFDPATEELVCPGDQRWHMLVAQIEMLNAAAALAWNALVDAYWPSADGMIRPRSDLLQRYHSACAMRAAAEAELLVLLQPQTASKADGTNQSA